MSKTFVVCHSRELGETFGSVDSLFGRVND